MVRATKAQIRFVEDLMLMGADYVDKHDLTIASADAYIKSNKIIADYNAIGDLRPEDLNVFNH